MNRIDTPAGDHVGLNSRLSPRPRPAETSTPALVLSPSSTGGAPPSNAQKFRRKAHTTREGSLKLCLWGAATRAKKKGIPFNIKVTDLELPDTCMFTGNVLKYGAQNDWDAASIDRIRPELGYVKGNVRIISRRANMIRFDCVDPAIFRALADDAERIARSHGH